MSKSIFYKSREVINYSPNKTEIVSNMIVTDTPLIIFLNGNELSTLICSPGNYEALAVGFLLSEGLIHKYDDIKEICLCEEEGIINIKTVSSGCLKNNCLKKKETLFFLSNARRQEIISSTKKISASYLLKLMSLLEEQSNTFRLTGGVHSVALADSTGLLVRYEDIGRHNAVDKVLGHVLLNHISPVDKCILISGRVAPDIIMKVARSGIALIVSRSAPTNMALELSNQFGISVVGFARGEKLNVYTHTERVIL